MGYCVVKNNDRYIYNLVEIVCDEETDIAGLPTTFSPGSKAFVIETSSNYMLSTNKVWKKYVQINTGTDGTEASIASLTNKVNEIEDNALYKAE